MAAAVRWMQIAPRIVVQQVFVSRWQRAVGLRRKSAGDELTVVLDGHPGAAMAESASEEAAGG